ncbi:hypothetical protein GGP41_003226 [Bipolaris sorokiniana]|uniref:Uncharacterized protein n=1 Tax=Cochliobolus sativus TaxID=45130 RepID=A0A8H5ZCU4_COCSA|nr:hypothetical protein GGP41_003226 [Bipolaris sorokiniana]
MNGQNTKQACSSTMQSARANICSRSRESKELKPPISETNPSTNVAPDSGGPKEIHFVTTFRHIEASQSNEGPSSALALELKTPRLNNIHRHLWLAGRPTAARPLHRQKLLGRTILITEDPNEHLVWFEDQVFIKPLPDFLLDWQSWNNDLCLDRELHEAASGFLLSYAWLVRHKSDLEIAKEAGLLSKDIAWSGWVEFIDTFLNNIDCQTLSDVDQRYKYGELRLSRLNSIYRLLPPKYSFRNLIGGYQSRSKWYQAFFDRHFKWMLAVFAILSVVLSALQVGLATTTLQGNEPFQSASYGFTITSLVAVVASVAVVFLVWLGLFCYYLLATWLTDRAVNRSRSEVRSA